MSRTIDIFIASPLDIDKLAREIDEILNIKFQFVVEPNEKYCFFTIQDG